MFTGNSPINTIRRSCQIIRSDESGKSQIQSWAHCGSHLAFRFRDILTDVLGPVRALLNKDRLTRLGVSLDPDDRLVGGHVHAELLVVQVDGLAGLRGAAVTVLVGKVCVSSSPLLLGGFELGGDVEGLVGLP